jgi:hypothetical protein
MLVIAADGQFEQGRSQIVSYLTPVKPGVNQEYHKSAKDQRQKTQRNNPVRTFHPMLMPNICRV